MPKLDDIERRQLLSRARQWCQHDPDPETRAQLEQMLHEPCWQELESCMQPLAFGTAGLRAVEGPGPGRMNIAVVTRTARGLADYLHQHQPESSLLPVVVGYDARQNSRRYAEVLIRVLLGAGIHVRYFPSAVPTPLVAYAARYFGAQAAVCITASHNPREYAGLKVYADNAVQIVAPADAQIARAIERVPMADQVPLGPPLASTRVEQDRLDAVKARAIDEHVSESYLQEIVALRRSTGQSSLRIVYTPLCGVGGRWMLEALRRAGYAQLFPVPEQFEPNPAFPGLSFPNPEEPGVLDRALEQAKAAHADLVLANDPDADRLAVCVPGRSGSFRSLSGNLVGLLLCEYLLSRQPDGPQPLVVSTVVSSPMLESIAAAHGARAVRTLTGFKWILNAGLALEREQGFRLVLGFEEALGYCVRGPVHDKDGISAGLIFADLVAELNAHGQGVDDALERLYRQHGVWASHLNTLIWTAHEGPGAAARKLQALVALAPRQLQHLSVLHIVDYNKGAHERPWYLGEAAVVELQLEGQARVLVRPSGTEPKLKVYSDYRADYVTGEPVADQERRASQRADELGQALIALLNDL